MHLRATSAIPWVVCLASRHRTLNRRQHGEVGSRVLACSARRVPMQPFGPRARTHPTRCLRASPAVAGHGVSDCAGRRCWPRRVEGADARGGDVRCSRPAGRTLHTSWRTPLAACHEPWLAGRPSPAARPSHQCTSEGYLGGLWPECSRHSCEAPPAVLPPPPPTAIAMRAALAPSMCSAHGRCAARAPSLALDRIAPPLRQRAGADHRAGLPRHSQRRSQSCTPSRA